MFGEILGVNFYAFYLQESLPVIFKITLGCFSGSTLMME